jgi:hypothetical protein
MFLLFILWAFYAITVLTVLLILIFFTNRLQNPGRSTYKLVPILSQAFETAIDVLMCSRLLNKESMK